MAAAAPLPSLASLCAASIVDALPRFCIRAGDSPAAVECIAQGPLRQMLHHLTAERCAALRRHSRGADAAAWAAAAAAFLAALSASDPVFAATLVVTSECSGRALLMLPACANLRALSLRGVATDDAARAAAACPRLARLDATRSPVLSAAAAAALAAGACASTLAVLQVSACRGVDDAFVAAAAALPSLRHLDVSETAVTDAALAHLLRRRTPLACLRVARCAGVRARRGEACWADALVEALPRLSCLDAAGTAALVTPVPCLAAATAALAAAAPSAEASAVAALAERRLAPPAELAERRALAHAWGGSHVAALMAAAADAQAGAKRGRGELDATAASWAKGAKSAARVAPWARPAPPSSSQDPW